MFTRDDTIIAPATAVGIGAISIIRLSGSCAKTYLEASFTPAKHGANIVSHRLIYGVLKDTSLQVIDHVMAVYMQGPASFTGEDVVEIHCHANPYIVKQILSVFRQHGARYAEAGEFSYRAFVNGRIDLSEAEAIAELLEAGSDTSAKIALQHLEGSISALAQQLHEQLFQILVLVEAYLDFPEDEVENVHLDMLHQSADLVIDHIQQLISSFSCGRVMREGLSILILGKPNVGKSSLLNYLLGRDRAIVTDIPGTTRDFIEESITLGHLPVKLVDTAGLRESDDVIEQSGVQRALERVDDVDLILYVIDGSDFDPDNPLEQLNFGSTPYLVVLNKADKVDVSSFEFDFEHICVSALSGYGIDNLKRKIEETFMVPESADSVVITEQRHYDIFHQVLNEVLEFKQGLSQYLPGEFLACHIREAMSLLGRITGETVPEDILNHIFSRFCVGK
jgi:tRNA modification GTPase